MKKYIPRKEVLRLLNVTSNGLRHLEKKGLKYRFVKDSKYTNPAKEYLYDDVNKLIDRRRHRVRKDGIKSKDGYGYVYVQVSGHPYSNSNGCVYEHRLAMEKKLGRYLTELEVIHHIDGDRSNNKISNLKLYSNNSEHLKNAHELAGRILKACINLSFRKDLIDLLEKFNI